MKKCTEPRKSLRSKSIPAASLKISFTSSALPPSAGDAEVLIVGAGPTGLMLACQLSRWNIPYRIIDEKPGPSEESRAFGVQSRTLELMETLGLAEKFTALATRPHEFRGHMNRHEFASFDIAPSLFPESPYAGLYFLPQSETERILLDHLEQKHGVHVERKMRLLSIQEERVGEFSSERESLAIDLGASLPSSLPDSSETAAHDVKQKALFQNLEHVRSESASFTYIVGCDGARSTVRHLASLSFEGEDYEQEFMLVDCEVEGLEHEEDFQFFLGNAGLMLTLPLDKLKPTASGKPSSHLVASDDASGETLNLRSNESPKVSQGRKIRLMGSRRVQSSKSSKESVAPIPQTEVAPRDSKTNSAGSSKNVIEDIGDLSHTLISQKLKIKNCTWSSRFHLHHRGVEHYRKGNIFVAGDAAHIHSPVGAQGMNTGIQDAANLGWKLAYVIKGWSDDSLLDNYHDERHLIGHKLLTTTDRVFSFMTTPGPLMTLARTVGFPTIMTLASKIKWMRKKLFGFMSQTQIRYHTDGFVKEECELADRAYLNGPPAGVRAPIFDRLLRTSSEAASLRPSKQESAPAGGHKAKSQRSSNSSKCVALHFEAETSKSRHHGKALDILIADYSEQVRLVRLNLNSDAEVFESYGMSGAGLVLVRPDGHIGYRACHDRPEPLAHYLADLLSGLSRTQLSRLSNITDAPTDAKRHEEHVHVPRPQAPFEPVGAPI